MSGFLLDTSSLSLLAPDRIAADAATAVRRHSDVLFLPTIAVCEIHAGIRKLHRQGGRSRAEALEDWLTRLLAGFGTRVLAFDTDAARHAGSMSDEATAKGRHPGFADIVIAAIARSNDLVVITENQRHFEALGVEIVGLRDLD